jgi:hypothetical protein
MKLAIFCIGGLNSAILSHVRMAALDSIAHRNIESTIPSEPLTAWTSAWTGLGPAIHGKVAGVKGRKPNLPTIWDKLKHDGYTVTVYDEGEWTKDDKVDVGVYKLDSFSNSIVAGDLANAQETLNTAIEMIEQVKKIEYNHKKIPYLIISAYGTAKYTTSLNLDKFLIARSLIKMNDRGIEYKRTLAYPANYTGKKPRMSYGIMLNSHVRARGFMEDRQVMNIQGNLMMLLNDVDGIMAKPNHLQYDINGPHFYDMPDIVLSSPGHLTCFRSVGSIQSDVLTPYFNFALSNMGLIASNEADLLRDVNLVTEVGKVIDQGVRLHGE